MPYHTEDWDVVKNKLFTRDLARMRSHGDWGNRLTSGYKDNGEQVLTYIVDISFVVELYQAL